MVASATESGWQIMTLLLGLIVGAVGAGQIVARTGRWKWLLLAAMVVGVLGMVLLSGLTADSSMPLVWTAMFLTGLGLGPISSVLTAVVQTTSPPDVLGAATSTLTFFRQLGRPSGSLSVVRSSRRPSVSNCPRKFLANGVPAELTAGLTDGPSAAASEESATVGDLGVAILSEPAGRGPGGRRALHRCHRERDARSLQPRDGLVVPAGHCCRRRRVPGAPAAPGAAAATERLAELRGRAAAEGPTASTPHPVTVRGS